MVRISTYYTKKIISQFGKTEITNNYLYICIYIFIVHFLNNIDKRLMQRKPLRSTVVVHRMKLQDNLKQNEQLFW